MILLSTRTRNAALVTAGSRVRFHQISMHIRSRFRLLSIHIRLPPSPMSTYNPYHNPHYSSERGGLVDWPVALEKEPAGQREQLVSNERVAPAPSNPHLRPHHNHSTRTFALKITPGTPANELEECSCLLYRGACAELAYRLCRTTRVSRGFHCTLKHLPWLGRTG